MEIDYSVFQRNRMIRKGAEMTEPRISVSSQLILPKNSLLHYLPDSKVDIGPQSDYLVFKNVMKPIPVYQVTELVNPPSKPREIAFDPNKIIRGYLEKNRRFRKVTDIEKAPRDEKTLLVVNYSLIHNRYAYVRSQYSEYNEWLDLASTVTSKINEYATVTGRHQFLILNVPRVLPSISKLIAAKEGMNPALLKIFNSDQSRWLLEVWKWLDKDGPKDPAAASVFKRIEDKNLRFVNIILEDSGNWICFNLAMIKSWLQSTHDEYDRAVKDKVIDPREVKKESQTRYSNLQMQKYFLYMYMQLMAGRSVSALDASVASDVDVEKTNDPKAVKTTFPKKEEPEGTTTSTDEEDQTPTVDEDGERIIPVKKELPQGTSTESTPKSTKEDTVKSSRELLKAASQVYAPDDDAGASITEEINKLIDADLAELETLNQTSLSAEDEAAVKDVDHSMTKPLAIADERTYEQKTRDQCAMLADAGLMTAAEYKRMVAAAEKYRTLPDPFGSGKPMIEAMVVTPEELKVDMKNNVAPKATVTDESLRFANVEQLDKKYIRETYRKHLMQCLVHIQSGGLAIDSLEVFKTETILGETQNFTMRVIPIEGAPTTLRFPIPDVQDDGTFTTNGVKYTARRMRGDFPIRKVAPNKVALTSYYGKFFVYRSRKAVNDYRLWITEEVHKRYKDDTNQRIVGMKTSDVFAQDIKAPRSISSLAKTFKEIDVTANDGSVFKFHLDLKRMADNFPEKEVLPNVRNGYTPIAIDQKGRIIYYEGDAFYLIHGGKTTALGEFEDIIDLSTEDAPVEFVELKIAGKYVPIGIILAADYGLSELIRRLKVNVRRVPVGTRVNAQPNEVALTFSDETILFSKSDRMACLLLGGFLEFKRVIRGFNVGNFDSPGVYQAVLDSTGGGARVIREIRHARNMFVDPITRDVLTKLKQPTDFMNILVYATELLQDDLHRDELDMSEMRIKGYERFAGMVYSQLVRSIRDHSSRPGKSRYPIDLKPYAIWQRIQQDQAVVTVKDINPIESLKHREEVTYSGDGGRSDATMTASTREYTKSDLGIISEATKDSGAVGINTYLPQNPNLENTLGMPIAPENRTLDVSSVFSTSILNAPIATRDDMKRQGFTSIQNAHSLPVIAQQENILRTGEDSVIPHRTGELWAVSAEQGGRVMMVTDDGLLVKYDDGTERGYKLGRQFGDNAGMVIPHMLVANKKEGQKFEKGDILSYNSGFFKPDTLNPNQVTLCNGTYAWIGLCEPSDTLEDASVISEKLAGMLRTEQTKLRTIVMNFDQSVHRMVKPGQKLDYDDVLCIIEDSITTGIDLYDEIDIESLKALGSQAPKAKYEGVAERIEIYYRGEKEDMSESIRALVNKSDREIAQRRRSTGRKSVTGEVDEGFKIKGNPLPMNSIAIRVFITGPETAGIGDKVVFVNQLKSIIGKVIKEPMIAADGTEILGRFSYTSVARRIVNSPEITGTTVAILMKGSKLMVEAYDS
jgi:hypothetical protein